MKEQKGSLFESLDRKILGKYFEDYNYATMEKIEVGLIVPLLATIVIYPLLSIPALAVHFSERGIRNFNWGYGRQNLPTIPKIIYRMGRTVKEFLA